MVSATLPPGLEMVDPKRFCSATSRFMKTIDQVNGYEDIDFAKLKKDTPRLFNNVRSKTRDPIKFYEEYWRIKRIIEEEGKNADCL